MRMGTQNRATEEDVLAKQRSLQDAQREAVVRDVAHRQDPTGSRGAGAVQGHTDVTSGNAKAGL